MDEVKLKNYVEEGLSISKIASAEGKSKTSVRHWLKKFGLKTNCTIKKHTLIQNCSHCGTLLTENNGYWRKNRQIWNFLCRGCSASNSRDRWENNKKRALDYKGGECQVCGYNKCSDAMEFHHVDPATKDRNMGNMKLRKWEDQKIELDKCILVCSNCHREIHHEDRKSKNLNL
jgi:DNA-binding transcriptional ArsR family regulator